MTQSTTCPEGYEVSVEDARIDAARVHRWLSTDTYWALGRSREKRDAAMAGSLNFGMYDGTSGEQVAYARVVTDRATFAWLCDVYVSPGVRGKGLGVALVGAVCAHLERFGLRRTLLATGDAHGVYEKVGFTSLAAPEHWMVRDHQERVAAGG
ncbi:GNAT family N-acetyltransferase [Streptomyces sp. NPDC005865]|uniref:GNAT family N-acetyltransferase n=1 Tax=Streptomyces sp. NPDC005865 TaxID=3155453 RepID=UPI00340EAD50